MRRAWTALCCALVSGCLHAQPVGDRASCALLAREADALVEALDAAEVEIGALRAELGIRVRTATAAGVLLGLVAASDADLGACLEREAALAAREAACAARSAGPWAWAAAAAGGALAGATAASLACGALR